METALLQYPIDKVFIRLQKILKKKGYAIVSTDPHQGYIKACKKRLFQKSISLNINASKINDLATRVDLSIHPHSLQDSKTIGPEKIQEKDLWNCIYDNF